MKLGPQSYMMLRVSVLDSIPHLGSDDAATPSIPKTAIQPIPEQVTKLVEVSLGVLANDRFVFLDQDFWICTWKIGSVYAKDEPVAVGAMSPLKHAQNVESAGFIKRHFTLPRH
jgi:hypothetical protein